LFGGPLNFQFERKKRIDFFFPFRQTHLMRLVERPNVVERHSSLKADPMPSKSSGALETHYAARWRAVEHHDAAFDRVFVYAVRSTGIYCRPSCPSRRPKRNRVLFFETPDQAERAGFRPCLRCRPQHPASSARFHQMCRYIQNHLHDPLSLAALGSEFHVSAGHLQRTFKREIGISPREYAEACRMDALKNLLGAGRPVTGALYDAGFASSSRLYERASRHLGMTPATYRKGGLNMQIQYSAVPCPLGWLLVAATEQGVCRVHLGDSEEALVRRLKSDLPNAQLQPAGSQLEEWIREIVSHLQGERTDLDLPLDVRATSFQQRVWRALRSIPWGATQSYREVAQRIGQPKAVRAVARACAANPVAIVVPCHRVVRSDGSLGGYAGGVQRKKALLALESTTRSS
jgi:AraC family transcriptional regulator, regulatory protein of adaptative response / methylated-DNA-[protein]-cysteine methyltransferase